MIESAAKRLNGIVDFDTVSITNHYAQKYTEIYSDKYIYIDEHASYGKGNVWRLPTRRPEIDCLQRKGFIFLGVMSQEVNREVQDYHFSGILNLFINANP